MFRVMQCPFDYGRRLALEDGSSWQVRIDTLSPPWHHLDDPAHGVNSSQRRRAKLARKVKPAAPSFASR